jgi:ketosteroid isomerase-like protein
MPTRTHLFPEEFLGRYELALATQDWVSVAPLIHDDACVTFSNGAYYQGKAEVQKAFEKNFGLIQEEKYSIYDICWIKKTDRFAVCTYCFHWQGLIRGEPASGSGRGTSILIKEKGKWLLLVEHLGPGNA